MHGADRTFQIIAIHFAIGHRKAVFAQERDHIRLIGKRAAFDIADVVKACVQAARAGHVGIQIAQRARSGIARILQRLLRRFIVLIQHGKLHKSFAVHLHAAGEWNFQRDRADGHRLRQNGFAGHAVAARGGLHQIAVFVGQIDGQPVELMLHHVFQFAKSGLPAQLIRALRPFAQCIDRLRLAHAPQPRDVRMRLKPRQHIAAHPPRGRIRQPFSAFRFQPDEFIVHRIPFLIGNRGIIQRIVLMGGFIQPVHQLAHAVHNRPPIN